MFSPSMTCAHRSCLLRPCWFPTQRSKKILCFSLCRNSLWKELDESASYCIALRTWSSLTYCFYRATAVFMFVCAVFVFIFEKRKEVKSVLCSFFLPSCIAFLSYRCPEPPPPSIRVTGTAELGLLISIYLCARSSHSSPRLSLTVPPNSLIFVFLRVAVFLICAFFEKVLTLPASMNWAIFPPPPLLVRNHLERLIRFRFLLTIRNNKNMKKIVTGWLSVRCHLFCSTVLSLSLFLLGEPKFCPCWSPPCTLSCFR